MRLILPYPISANRYWRTAVLRRNSPAEAQHAQTYVSAEAKRYKRQVRIAAVEQGSIKPIRGRVALGLQLYPHRPLDWERRMRRDPVHWDDTVQCLDLDNAFKVLNDALRGIAFDDDAWIRRIVAERMEPDAGGERVVVTVEPLALEHPQASLLPADRDVKEIAKVQREFNSTREKVPF